MDTSVALLLALALSTSGSKLGPHVLGSVSDSGAQTILAACPRVAKWLTPDGSVAASIGAYRSACPCGTVVLRVYVDGSTHYATSQDAAAAAADFWAKMQPGLAGIGTQEVDWLEGPNELDNLEDWFHDLAKAQWFASFWSALADAMNGAGWHPLVGSIAVGNPSLAGENGAGSPNYFQPIADAMKQKSYRWGWSYHAYTQTLSTDVGTELWLSLRYRTIRDQCGLGGVPLVLTEGGRDNGGGWQGHATAAQFMDWLEWLDARMQEDGEVEGVTLFQVGEHGTWQSFDLGPVASALATWLTGVPGPSGCSGPDAGVPPVRPDAGASAATMEFSPKGPIEGASFEVIVRSPIGYTNVMLTGTDPHGQATAQTGPKVAAGYSWTWTLSSVAMVGQYSFSFSADQVLAGSVVGLVTVVPTPLDAAVPGGSDAATADGSQPLPGPDAANPGNGDGGTAGHRDAGHVGPSDVGGSCGCGTDAGAFAMVSLLALAAVSRRRLTSPRAAPRR